MLEVLPFTAADVQRWDAFCEKAVNATLLHTRRFFCYHGERLRDASLLVLDEGRLVGVLPAAEAGPGTVASHPGATYGGLVHDGRMTGSRMLAALEACAQAWADRGYQRLVYKPLPTTYQRRPAQDDLYALFRLGALRFRADLSCAIDLAEPGPVSERRRRSLAKARKVVMLDRGAHLLPAFWAVLEENLARKHDARPVHTLDEISELQALFPGEIELHCALLHGAVEAGVLLFNGPRVWHAQYIAASEKAYAVGALDAVFQGAIASAAAAGTRYFDFGTSNEDGGRVLNEGLFRFKSEFGGGGVVHEHYELSLAGRAAAAT